MVSLSNFLSDIANVYIGFLHFASFSNDRPLLGEALGIIFASPYFHHAKVPGHGAHLGCHCCGVVLIFSIWIRVHVLSDPGQLGSGNPRKVWERGDIYCNCSYPLGVDRLCYPRRTHTRGQEAAATSHGENRNLRLVSHRWLVSPAPPTSQKKKEAETRAGRA